MKEVIVTGANGFIGSQLIMKLIDSDVDIVAIDISFLHSRLPESAHITRIESSVDDSLINKIPMGCYDAFYHLAWRGVNGEEKADPFVQISNIKMAIDCANICKQLNVKKLLCAGTVAENAVYSLSDLSVTTGGMMYGVAKHSCHFMLETYCKNICLPLVWMQFSNIYGVGNKTGNIVSYTLTQLLAGQEATFGPALQPYDFIYVEDLLVAIVRLGNVETSLSTYFIGSGKPRILKDYLARIGEIVGTPNKLCLGIRPDDGIRYSMNMFDTKQLQDTIGDYVSTDFDMGIVKTIKWMKSLSKG